jgi:hypothetical protein
MLNSVFCLLPYLNVPLYSGSQNAERLKIWLRLPEWAQADR